MGELATLKFDFRNVVTITLCGIAGYLLLLGVNMAMQRVQTMRAGG